MKKPGENTWEEKSWDSFSKKVELFSIMRDRIKKSRENKTELQREQGIPYHHLLKRQTQDLMIGGKNAK